MACFRDHSPITNRQKPSKVQVMTMQRRALAAAWPDLFWVRFTESSARSGQLKTMVGDRAWDRFNRSFRECR